MNKLNINTKYTGAGIFLIENYNEQPVVLLFGKHNKLYSDPGGNIDKGETLEETACRETKEETANLINIKPKELKIISKIIYLKSYVSYFVFINQIKSKDYYDNVEIIFNKCKEYFWKESNCIARVSIDELVDKMSSYDFTTSKDFYAKDINNKSILIRSRVMFIVKHGIDILQNVNSMKIENLYPKMTLYSDTECVIGTTTYITDKKN
jgi:hypothetical protein